MKGKSIGSGAQRFFFPVLIIAVMIVLPVVSGCKWQEKKKYVIGYVNPNPEEEEGAQAFLRSMPKFGYVEGKNVTYIKYESRDIKGVEAAVRNMVDKRVDLIFTITQPAAKIAKRATEGTNIPVVFVLYDAVRFGFAKSMTNPGANLTGVQLAGSTPKSLEFLLKIAPKAKHIFVPVKFDTQGARSSLEDLEQSAAKMNIKVTVSNVDTVGELRSSMSSMPKDVDAVFILHSWLVGSNLNLAIENAIKRRIPVFSAGHVDATAGVVMSYSPDGDRTGGQAARIANSILHGGIRPADLPVETADFLLGINLKTARAAGIEIPNDVLQQADFIVR